MRQPRKFLFGKSAKEKIFDGIELIYRAVSATLGPNGRNVLIDRSGQVVDLTKDGVTVAHEVACEDRYEEMGAQLLRDASSRTDEEAGDGTTTVIVLAHEMCKASIDIPQTSSVIKIRRGMEMAEKICLETIKELSFPIKTESDFAKVASISAQDTEIGTLIAKTFINAGENGSIEIERRDEPGIEVEKTDGLSFEKGYVIPHCINDVLNARAIQEDVPVLVTDRDIKNQHQLVPLMEKIIKELKVNKLFIVAENFSGDALGMIAANCQGKHYHVIPVRAPSFGRNRIEILQDIAAATGATFISEENGGLRLEKATTAHLGRAKRVVCERDKTVIIAENTDSVKEAVFKRIELIDSLLEEEKDEIKRDDLKKRLATLTDGITVIRVGGNAEQERRELMHRVEDAVRAVASAKEEGVAPGCGVTFLRCYESLGKLKIDDQDEQRGVTIVKQALLAPSTRVLEVAGVPGRDLLVSRMLEAGGNAGYDFSTGEIADMMKIGIYDPAKVVRCALQYAISTAKSFMTLDVVIADADTDRTLLQRLGAILGLARR